MKAPAATAPASPAPWPPATNSPWSWTGPSDRPAARGRMSTRSTPDAPPATRWPAGARVPCLLTRPARGTTRVRHPVTPSPRHGDPWTSRRPVDGGLGKRCGRARPHRSIARRLRFSSSDHGDGSWSPSWGSCRPRLLPVSLSAPPTQGHVASLHVSAPHGSRHHGVPSAAAAGEARGTGRAPCPAAAEVALPVPVAEDRSPRPYGVTEEDGCSAGTELETRSHGACPGR